MNPQNYYTIFTRKSKPQKLVILSETQCSEVSKSHESKYYQINVPKANPKNNYANSPKVSDSLSIHNSPKWILRLFQRLSMTALLFLTIPSANLSNLHAVELSSIIPNCQGSGTGTTNCDITTAQGEVTNNGYFAVGGDVGININAQIDTFINYGTIYSRLGNQTIAMGAGGYIGHLINYGNMEPNGKMLWIVGGSGIGTITNYGFIGGIEYGTTNNLLTTLTLNNLGLMGTVATNSAWTMNLYLRGRTGSVENKILIQNYTVKISSTATDFSNFTNTYGQDRFGHLTISTYGIWNDINDKSVSFKDKNSRILLDFGADFELGKEYPINKIVTDNNGNPWRALGVDFSRLSTRNDIYSLSQSGDNFVVSMNPQYGTMGMLYKSNIKTMSNLYLQSNNMIYPHKYKRKKFGSVNPNINPRNNNYRRVRGISNLFMNPQSLGESYAYNSTNPNNNTLDSSLNESTLADLNQSNYYANLPIQSNELFFYDNEWLLARDNANARKVNMDYTHSVKAVNNSNVSKDAYYNKGAYRNKIITNDTRTNEINQYQSTNRQGNVSRTPNQNNRHLANQSNNSPCGSYKCIYIYKPQQQTKQIQPQPKEQPKPQPKIEPKVVEQPKIEPKIQPQPKPIQVIRPTMPPPPKVEPKIEPKPIVQPKEQPKVMPKVEQPKPEPKVVKVESKPTPPKPKVIIQDPYYFILTPYIAHNFFYEAGRYNLSGLEYGFITAFSGKITEEHILGLHFAFSYGSLKDSVDSIFNIASMNIMGGLNYKFDMTNDMYLKARVDIFYFLNQVQSTMTSGNIMKPNNLGFGASVAYGKEWDFDKNGILGLEVALDYKGLMGNAFSFTSYANTTASYVDSYDKALYNMLYVDLGLNYDKYFESSVGKWGLDSGIGIRGNITANALAKSRVSAHNNARVTNMTLDNDRFIAYLNIGGSYLLESKDFDMEFSLAYYGNFGDRSMSNAGGFEWRVYW